MTHSDLDEIRKLRDALKDPAALKGPNEAAVASARLGSYASALLDEVERLQTKLGHMEKHVAVNDEEYLVMKDVLRAEHKACQELRARLALLEPVWDAAKVVHEIRQRMDALDDPHFDALDNEFGDAVTAMGRAIDAAVAKEGK